MTESHASKQQVAKDTCFTHANAGTSFTSTTTTENAGAVVHRDGTPSSHTVSRKESTVAFASKLKSMVAVRWAQKNTFKATEEKTHEAHKVIEKHSQTSVRKLTHGYWVRQRVNWSKSVFVIS